MAISAPASCSSFSSPAVSRLPRCLNEGGLLPRGPLTFSLTPLVHLSKYFTSLDSCENLTTAHFPLSTKVIRDLNHTNGHTDRSLEDLEYWLTSSLGNSILSLMMKQLLTNNWEVFDQTYLLPVNEYRVIAPVLVTSHLDSSQPIRGPNNASLTNDIAWSWSYGTDNNGQNNSEPVIRLVKVLAHGEVIKINNILQWMTIDMTMYFDLTLAHLIKGKNTLMSIHLHFLLLHRMILWWLPSIPHPTKFKSRHKKLIALILALLYFDHNCCKCQLSNCNHLTYE